MSELAVRQDPRARASARRGHAAAEQQGPTKLLRNKVTEEEVAEVVSKWTGIPVSKMLEGEQEKLLRMEEALAQARRRPGRSGARRVRCDPPLARGPVRSEPAERLVPVPRPDRRRQDRAVQGARRVPVRHRRGDGAHRHVRVHGEALGRAPDRRAARLCRLRGRRLSHRGRAPPAVLGAAARRSREGAPGRVQRAAAGSRRRPPDRRPGPHRRLPQHRDHHDLEPRLARDPGAGGRGELREDEAGRAGDRATALPARVHQPRRRHRRVPSARHASSCARSSTSSSAICAGAWRSGTSS